MITLAWLNDLLPYYVIFIYFESQISEATLKAPSNNLNFFDIHQKPS